MDDLEKLAGASEPTNEESLLKGLVAGLLDGNIQSFEYRGFRIQRIERSIAVADDDGVALGGRLLVSEGWNVSEVIEWLRLKVFIHIEGEKA